MSQDLCAPQERRGRLCAAPSNGRNTLPYKGVSVGRDPAGIPGRDACCAALVLV